jgi:hypothetical protein
MDLLLRGSSFNPTRQRFPSPASPKKDFSMQRSTLDKACWL